MFKKNVCLIVIPLLLVSLSGCATFKSDIDGKFTEESEKNFGAGKVDVLFIFSHYEQAKGLDAIPKLENKRQILRDFDDLFIDACNEFSNLDRYTTFTEFSSDVSDPSRRVAKDSLIASHDYIMRIRFKKENSFAKHFLGTLISTLTITTFPIAYKENYTIKVHLYNHEDILIQSYKRQASMTKWVQTLLVFVYPFHTEKRKEEEIYINLMHNVFKQIETEKVLM